MFKLRRLKPEDAQDMFKWMHDEEVVRYLSANFQEKTLEDCMLFIENSNKEEKTEIHRAIINNNDKYLGTVSLKNISRVKHDAEFAIVLQREAFGTGAAHYALRRMIQMGFGELQLDRIYLCVRTANKRAIRLYRKFGFLQISVIANSSNTKKEPDDLIWMEINQNDFVNKNEQN